MRAIEVTRFGPADVLMATDVPVPVAGRDQVVIGVHAADVLFLDTQIRAGAGRHFGVTPPYVPGNGVAGDVVETGEEVDHSWLGRRVVAMTAAAGPQGGYAERALANVSELVVVPDNMDLRHAAALLHDGPTALTLAANAGIKPGEWVLVTGSGGGLGVLLLQIAAEAGAKVIATARGRRKLDIARKRGVYAAVDYSAPAWTDQVREITGGAGVDVIFDGVGGSTGQAAFELMAPGGRFSAHGAPSGSFALVEVSEARRRGVTLRGIEQVQFAPADIPSLVSRALTEAVAGRLTPVIGQTFPLEDAAVAHRSIEERSAVGKTLLA